MSTEREIPIIAGDGISIDKAVNSEHIVIKNTKEGFLPTAEQQAALDSGITANKVTTYDGYQTAIDNALPLSGGTLTGELNGVRINTTGSITSGTNIRAGSTNNFTQLNDTGVLVQKDTSNRSIITGSANEFIRN